jgi:collagen type IV alpha-3-binding protein
MGRQEDIILEADLAREDSAAEDELSEEASEQVAVETGIKSLRIEELEVDSNNGDELNRKSHPLWPEIEKLSLEQLHYARQEVGEGWQLLEKDGDMIMYKREKEINGLVEDPLKASHTVRGVTAYEMCYYFFQPEYRMEWEHTVDSVKVVERISDDALIFHQLHKRIWPAAARDAAFWSHIRPVSSDKTKSLTWMVCNRSLSSEHPLAPVKKGNVRAFLTVILLCETLIHSEDDKPLSRENITCKVTYCSAVHPGGWAPPAIVREIAKHGYSKFLKTFTAYVVEKCKDKPPRFN